MSEILPTDEVAYVIQSALDEHKHVLDGVCACGEDLGARRGKYTAALREHTAFAVADTLRAAGLVRGDQS